MPPPESLVTGRPEQDDGLALFGDAVALLDGRGGRGGQIADHHSALGQHRALGVADHGPHHVAGPGARAVGAGGERALQELGQERLVLGEDAVFAVVGEVLGDVAAALDHLLAQQRAAHEQLEARGDGAHQEGDAGHQQQELGPYGADGHRARTPCWRP
jgi:hypothetical protein